MEKNRKIKKKANQSTSRVFGTTNIILYKSECFEWNAKKK